MQLYQSLNIRVVLVYSLTWTEGQQIAQTTDSGTLLDLFEVYHRENADFREIEHDSSMLITLVGTSINVSCIIIILVLIGSNLFFYY